jgi:uncharacterized protein YecE (DUF72 family)
MRSGSRACWRYCRPQHRYTFEFRELSWLKPEIFRILREFNAAFCIYELAGHHTPVEITADFSYIRLHGPHRENTRGAATAVNP